MTRHNKKALGEKDQLLIQEIMQSVLEKKSLSGPDGVFTKLLKTAYDAILEGEMDAYMQGLPESNSNRRNGTSTKIVKSSQGSFELETPRDRHSSFEPQLIKKRQTIITEEIDSKVIALFSLGTSYSDIVKYMSDIYGLTVGDATISAITDKLLDEIIEWRCRPLDELYPVLFLDGMYFKVRENGAVVTKVMYSILGIGQDGKKDILGTYLCESEGASFWLGVLNDLKARGIKDVLIACVDGLKGFPEAIATAFPRCEVQLCIVHQIRNSIKMIPSKHQKEFIEDLKTVYKAPSKSIAESNLNMISEKWKKYHMALKSWHENWGNLSAYFKFSPAIRRIVYTTNAIEGFHRQLRKYTKSKGAFTSENALLKLTFCAITSIMKKWTMPIHHWAEALSEFDLHFPNRLGGQF